MFVPTLFTLVLVVCSPQPSDGSPPTCAALSVPGFASSDLCEAAAPSVTRAMRPDGKGTAVGRCVPSTAPREA